MAARPPALAPLDFPAPQRPTANDSAAPDAVTSPNLLLDFSNLPPLLIEYVRQNATGVLRLAQGSEFPLKADDLRDIREIGEGAFGTVNMMKHVPSGTDIAVKRIRSTVNEREQKSMLRDLDTIMKARDCENIVQFYGAIFREGDCWICMELMDTSLDRLYHIVFDKMEKKIPEDILGKIAFSTVTALDYLHHNLRIIHRDVKPSNILLDRRGCIKLCDFGIAGQLIDSIAKTRDAGCQPYMAPERLSEFTDNAAYDIRSDVWSLGITMLEVARGRFPYPNWSSVFEQLEHVVKGDPPILCVDEGFTLDFVNFVNSCLTKDKAHRPVYKHKKNPSDQALMDMPFLQLYCSCTSVLDVDVAAFVSQALNFAHERDGWVTF